MKKTQENKRNTDVIRKTSIGGQALIEGIMMRGPEKTAMAVRNPAGEMVLEEVQTKKSNRPACAKWPLLRGVFGFIDSMSLGYKCLMRSAEIAVPEEENDKEKDPEKIKSDAKKESVLMSALMVLASVLGVVLALFLFVWLPAKLYMWLSNVIPFFDPENRYEKSVFEGILKVLILVGYMALMSCIKDMRRTFMYHGAEHQTIFCYEMGLELTVENVRRQRRFHPRCGTSFLVLMVLVGIVISFLIPPTWKVIYRVLLKLALIPLIMGIGYELIKFAGRHDNLLTRIISAPGMWLQHVTVLKPDDGMIECAIAAFKAVLPQESDNLSQSEMPVSDDAAAERLQDSDQNN